MARAVRDDVSDETGARKRFRDFANGKKASRHRKIAFGSGNDSRKCATSKKKDDFPKRGLDRRSKAEECRGRREKATLSSRKSSARGSKSIDRENRGKRGFAGGFGAIRRSKTLRSDEQSLLELRTKRNFARIARKTTFPERGPDARNPVTITHTSSKKAPKSGERRAVRNEGGVREQRIRPRWRVCF